MPDGSARRRDDDELPPDPWAGLAGSVPRPPQPPPQPPSGPPGYDDPTWRPGDEPAARPPGWRSHPSVTPDGGHQPPPRRTIWHHPAIWIVLLVLAVVLLLSAVLEPRPAPRDGSDPDAITAAEDAGSGATSVHPPATGT